MQAFIYQAALWCAACCDDIEKRLTSEGNVDTGDSGDWPQDAGGDGGGEADTPQHCDGCHRPLENPLTSEGVAYVVEAVQDRLRKGTDPGDWRWPDGYYVGLDKNEVLRDWAGDLHLADLEPKDAKTVSLFLFWTRPARERSAA